MSNLRLLPERKWLSCANSMLLKTCSFGLCWFLPALASSSVPASPKIASDTQKDLATAQSYYAEQQYAQAEHELRVLLQHYPRNYFANELLGLTLSAEAREAEATSYFETAVHTNPSSLPARENLAANYAKRNKNALAESQFRTLVRLDPKNFDLQHNLGEFYVNLGKIASAVGPLKAAQELRPTDYSNGYDLSLAEMMSGRLIEAQTQIEKLLSVKETSELHSMLAEVYERENKFLLAAREYQRAVQIDPAESVIFDWGTELLRHKNLQEAMQVFSSGVKLYPSSWRMNIGLGLSQHMLGDDQDAVTALVRAVDLNTSDSRSYFFLATLDRVPAAQLAEVATRFERYAIDNPQKAQAQLYYATNLWQSDVATNQTTNLEKVESLLKRAVALDPKLVQAHMQLGILYVHRGDYSHACSEFQQAVRLDPSLAMAHYRLGQVLMRLGEKQRAAQELQMFSKLNSTQKTEDPVITFLLTRQDNPK